jgi:16S rRNA G966 N2-methylase RsmD
MNKKTGKIMEVLIEDNYFIDEKTGVEHIMKRIVNVWANAGMSNVIKEVPGVTNVFNNDCPTLYMVFLDPRYDRDFVKKEIEAVIVCA